MLPYPDFMLFLHKVILFQQSTNLSVNLAKKPPIETLKDNSYLYDANMTEYFLHFNKAAKLGEVFKALYF